MAYSENFLLGEQWVNVREWTYNSYTKMLLVTVCVDILTIWDIPETEKLPDA